MIKLAELSNRVQSHTITAIIDTALCIGASGSSISLADKPIVRNAEKNLLIPGSQLKGRLRHECEKIARGLKWNICYSPNPQTMCPQQTDLAGDFTRYEYKVSHDERYHCLICQIFGNPVLPSQIIFDDLICTEDPQNLYEVFRPGVTINRHRRTSEDEKLYFIETSLANVKLKFKGEMHLFNVESYANILILAGLRHINALGGSKSAGLGWLHWELPDLCLEQTAWDFLAKGSRN